MEMEELIGKLQEYLTLYGMNLIAAIFIFVVGKWLARIISNIVEKILIKSKVEPTIASFTKHLTYVGLVVFIIVAAISKIGVETTSLVAAIGAAGLAVGLALQGSLANFAAGVLLIFFKPFKVNDFVEAGGATGTVKEIQIFNTVMLTLDNRKIILPNAKVTGDNIINYTDVKHRRIDLVFGISYTDDTQKAKDALLEVLRADARVLKKPEPFVAISELADSSVNVVCRPWVKPADYWDTYFDITEKGKIALERAGITIPFPQRDIHVYQENK